MKPINERREGASILATEGYREEEREIKLSTRRRRHSSMIERADCLSEA